MAARDPRTPPRLGRGLDRQRGRRARGAYTEGGRPHSLRATDGEPVSPATQPAGARSPVLALRAISREDVRALSREHAPLAHAAARGGVGRGDLAAAAATPPARGPHGAGGVRRRAGP